MFSILKENQPSVFLVVYLAIRGAVRFDDPTGFVAESLEDFIVVAVLWELVVAIHSQAGEDLRRYSSSPSLSSLVVLSLLPCWLSRPRRHRLRRKISPPTKNKNKKDRKFD